jgi:hypothetical protein
MGVIVNKENERNTELNQKIAADLRARAQKTSGISDPDLAEDIDYVKNTKKTGRFAWVWVVLVAMALISLVSIVLI